VYLQAGGDAMEYLQARILESLQRSEAMIPLAFQGDTALRFLFDIARFSEDLDFVLERPSEKFNFRAYLKNIQSTFKAEGYQIHIKLNDQTTVHNAFVRFPGLLNELDLSPHKNEAISVKIEVDTNPPHGARLETTIVRKFIPLNIQFHDRASLFSGKLHAILQRNYAKGRDLYDLMWYLSDPHWPEPNFILLNNALQQSGWTGSAITPENWRELIYNRLLFLDWEAALSDVRNFLIRPNEIDLLTIENLGHLLQQSSR
jgi:predicted nucleotidyltransferase component of viral defense system